MTWSRVKATGSGRVALRLVIEGMENEWVTDAGITGSGSDGRTRRVGFVGSSFTFSETVDIAKATNASEGFTARIVDVDEAATDDFASMPTAVTYLAANISTSGTSLAVLDSGVFVIGDYIDVDTETMYVSAIPNPLLLTVQRSKRDTITQAHYTSDGATLRAPQVTNRPVSIEGRRVYVHAYGDGETGDGHLIYRGICATEARLSGDSTTWEITIDPISSLFDQQVGLDLEDAVPPRGILYHTDGDLSFELIAYTSADAGAPTLIHRASFKLAAYLGGTDGYVFYENQEEFCEAVNGAFITATAAWGAYAFDDGTTAGAPMLKCVPDGNAGWHLELTTGSTARWHNIQYYSNIDCCTPARYGPGQLIDAGGESVVTVAASTTYRIPFDDGPVPGAGSVPRGQFWGTSPTGRAAPRYGSANNLIPLGGAVLPIGAFNTAKCQWPALGPYPEEEIELDVRDIDATNRFIRVDPLGDGTVASASHVWTAAGFPQIRFSRVLTFGNLWDFLEELMASAPDGGNIGRVPFIISDEDIDSSTSEATIDQLTAGSPILSARAYGQFKPMKLADIVRPELLLMGAIMSTNSSGQITFRKLQTLAPTEPTSGTLSRSEQLSSKNFPTWERNAFGSVNTVVLKTGWDPRADEYNGRTFIVRDVGALGRNKTARKLEIEPKSYLDGDDSGITDMDVTSLVSPLLGLLGYPYDVVTIPVPLTCFDLHIGDNVTITSDQIPSSSGVRGVTSASGIIIGRKWSICEGFGELTMLVTLQNIAGYAPTWRVISFTGTNPYTVTVTAASQPDGYATIADLSVGDYLQFATIDTASPTVRTGFVSTIPPGTETFTITLSAAMPGGVVNIDYQSATAVQVTQQDSCFMASGTATISFAPTPTTARTLAP